MCQFPERCTEQRGVTHESTTEFALSGSLGVPMTYLVRLERRKGRPLAVVIRHAAVYELSKVVPDARGAVWKFIRSQRILGAGRHVAVYLDDRLHLQVGVELAAERQIPTVKGRTVRDLAQAGAPGGTTLIDRRDGFAQLRSKATLDDAAAIAERSCR